MNRLPILQELRTPPRVMHDLSAITALAAIQHGAVHRQQVRELGYPKYQLARWIAARRLDRAGPNTFVIPGSPDIWERSLTVAVLELGPGTLVACRSAAALHGFDGYQPGPVEVLIARSQRRTAPNVVVHTTDALRPQDRTEVRGFACTSAVRTILDLAGAVSPHELAAAVDSAVRDRLVSEDYLRRELLKLRGAGRAGVVALDAVLRDIGGHSWLERRFLGLVRQARLPRPRCQVVHREGSRGVARTDFFWHASELVVEVAGHGRHASPSERQRDAERHTELQLRGYLVLTFTYEDVTERPAWVVARVREALRLGRSRRGSAQVSRESST